MSLYENINCPVCNREFQKDDDIVTCPECGTPHHRECYDLIGRCVNAGLHKANYDFFSNEIKAESDTTEEMPVKTGEYHTSADNQQSEDTNEDNIQNSFSAQFFMPPIDSSFEQDSDTIDGESVADFAAVIRKNIDGFIRKFKRLDRSKSSLSWNWGAFFFGSLYMLFRKIYKQGVAFFCLFLTSMYACSALIFKFAPVFSENLINLMSSGNKTVTPEQMETVMNSADYGMAMKITYIFFGVMLVLRVIEALFTDRIYKNTVSSIIKRVKEQLDEGATFIQTPLFESQGQNLDQVQMRRLYLSRRGGVNILAPMTALLIICLFL